MQCGMRMQAEMIQALQVVGGLTRSIFPQAEAWLLNDTLHQKALRHVAQRKDMDRYHSMMDFLFCELFTEYRFRCFRYYDSEGPMLKDILSVKELVYYSNALLQALEIAYATFNHHERTNWTRFRCKVLKAIAA
jgi:hypothetical protein